MTGGDVAGLIAAGVFAVLVALLAVPILKLGRVFDELRVLIRDLNDETEPLLEEVTRTVATTNSQLEKVDVITNSVSDASANMSAMTSLVASTVGQPIIKTAAFSSGVRRAFSADAVRARREERRRAREAEQSTGAGAQGGATGSTEAETAAEGTHSAPMPPQESAVHDRAAARARVQDAAAPSAAAGAAADDRADDARADDSRVGDDRADDDRAADDRPVSVAAEDGAWWKGTEWDTEPSSAGSGPGADPVATRRAAEDTGGARSETMAPAEQSAPAEDAAVDRPVSGDASYPDDQPRPRTGRRSAEGPRA